MYVQQSNDTKLLPADLFNKFLDEVKYLNLKCQSVMFVFFLL